MTLFSKVKNLFANKKKVSSQIKEKNEKDSVISQNKFDDGLKLASSSLNSSINQIAVKFRTVDQNLMDEIEESLISFDIGQAATKKILNSIIDEIKLQNVNDVELIRQIILDKLFVYYIQDTDISPEINIKKNETNVILVSGVNGVGKTTSIAKLANLFLKQKYSVCLIAADTFRAGAVAQLET
jgi:fused signal recognition particle receptor